MDAVRLAQWGHVQLQALRQEIAALDAADQRLLGVTAAEQKLKELKEENHSAPIGDILIEAYLAIETLSPTQYAQRKRDLHAARQSRAKQSGPWQDAMQMAKLHEHEMGLKAMRENLLERQGESIERLVAKNQELRDIRDWVTPDLAPLVPVIGKDILPDGGPDTAPEFTEIRQAFEEIERNFRRCEQQFAVPAQEPEGKFLVYPGDSRERVELMRRLKENAATPKGKGRRSERAVIKEFATEIDSSVEAVKKLKYRPKTKDAQKGKP